MAATLAINTPKRPRSNKTKSEYTLLSFHEVPEYLQDNPHILTCYRPLTELSPTSVFLTLFKWHNETLNIWIHLAGAAVFVAFLAALSSTPWQQRVFQAAAVFCFLSSAFYHLVGFVSHKTHAILIRIDFIGIATVMAAMYVPWILAAFHDSPLLQGIYMGMAGLIATLTLGMALQPAFTSPAMAQIRPILFGLQGMAAVIPIAHASSIYPGRIVHARPSPLLYTFLNYLFQFAGATLYALKLPERLSFGTFDTIGHSHQLFHAFTVAGLLCFNRAIDLLFMA